MTLLYPPPEENPLCQCQNDTRAQFFCEFGHVLECHYPYTCKSAACSRLHQYQLSREERDRRTEEARSAIANGQRDPYIVDEHGNVWIEQGDE